MRRAVGLALASLLLCANAFAQERSRRPGAGEGRAEAWRMIDAYVMGNLQESLGLTDEQFVRLLPLVKKLLKDRRDLAQQRRQALQDLRRTLASGAGTEAKALEQLKALKALEVEEPATIGSDLSAVDASLTPTQQARFRVLEAETEARIRQMLNRVRAERRLGRKGTGPPPAPEGDTPEP